MSWFGSASEWKQGLSSFALGKVEELENQAEKHKREKIQKQNQLDTLQQALDKQKRKTEDVVKQRQSLEKEIEQLGRTCELLQGKLHKGSNDTSCSVADSFSLGSEKVLRKRVQDLESENKNLQDKFQESCGKVASNQVQPPKDHFWSHFSSSGSECALPQKSPFKTTVKKALETSEENPFKAPILTPHKKGLEISEENPFKTPRKYASVSSLPAAPPPTSNNDYTIQLEKKLEHALKEIEDLKCEKNSASSANSPQDVEICSLKTFLEKAKADCSAQEQQLQLANDQISFSKTKVQDLEIKIEDLEQRLKSLQTELDCQRQNSETAKKHLENKLKEKEKEFITEASRLQTEISSSEARIQELSVKLQQKEVLLMNNQNSLQASLDKVSSQLDNAEKEKLLSQNHCSQLETAMNQLQKSDEEAKKMITQLRQDKEMIKAQVDSLKLKLSETESHTNRLQSQLAASEQLAMAQKTALEEAVMSHKLAVEKEKESHKLALENIVNEKLKLLKENEIKGSKTENELHEVKESIQMAEKEKREAMMKLKQMEEDCQQKLAGVNDLEAKVSDLEHNLKEKETTIEKREIELKEEFEKTKMELEKELQTVKTCFERATEESKMNEENLKEKLEEQKEKALTELRQKSLEMEEQYSASQRNEEKTRGEKLTVELNLWESEGKIEALRNAEENLQQKKQELMEKIFKLEDSLQEQKTILSSKESENETLNKSLQEASNTIASLVATLEDAKIKLEGNDKIVVELIEKVELINKNLIEREATIELLNQEKSRSEKAFAETCAEYEKKSEEKAKYIKHFEEKVKDVSEVKESLVRQIQTLNEQIHTSQTKYQTMKQNYDDKLKENEIKINEYEVKLLLIKKENDTLKALEARVTEMTEKGKRLEEIVVDREEQIKQLQEIIQTLSDQISERSSAMVKLEEVKNSESERYKGEIDALINSNSMLEKSLSESADNIVESERFIKILEEENENLSQTLNEANENTCQLNSSKEELKQELRRFVSDYQNLSITSEEMKLKLSEIEKEYEKTKQKLSETDSKLSQELLLSREKSEEWRRGEKLIRELKMAIKSLEENRVQLTEKTREIEKENERLVLKLNEEKAKKEQLIEEIEGLDKGRFEAEGKKMNLEEMLKMKESQIMDLEKVAAEIREEFDSELKKLTDKLKSTVNDVKLKEEQHTQIEEEKVKLINVCDEFRDKLSHQENVNKGLSIDFESYREVVDLMRRETSQESSQKSDEMMMEQNDNLQRLNFELQTTVTNLGKKILELQRKNSELFSSPKDERECKESVTQTESSVEDFCRYSQATEGLRKELDDRESEVVDMGERMQDLFADVDKLNEENKNLKLKLGEALSADVDTSEHNNSLNNSILMDTLKEDLNQAKMDLQRIKEQKDFNVLLAQELDEKVESLRNELNRKLAVEKELRKELNLLKENYQTSELVESFTKLKKTFESLELEHKKLQEEMTKMRNQSKDLGSCDKMNLKEKEMAELTQELIYVNGQLEAKNNDLTKDNNQLNGMKEVLSNKMEEVLCQNSFYEKEIQNIQKKLDVLADENAVLSNEIRNQKLTMEELENERSSFITANKKLLEENADLILRNEALKEKQQCLEYADNNQNESVGEGSNEEKMEYIKAKLSACKELLKSKTKELERLEMRMELITEEMEPKEARMEAEIRQIQEIFETRVTEVEGQNEELQEEILRLKSLINKLEADKISTENEIREINLKHDSEMNATKTSASNLKNKNDELNLKLRSTVEEGKICEKKLKHTKVKEEELNSSILNLRTKLENLDKEKAKVTERYDALKLTCQGLEDEKEKTTNNLQSALSSLNSDIANSRREVEEMTEKNRHLMEEKENYQIQMKEKEDIITKNEKDIINLTTRLQTREHREKELKARVEKCEITEKKLNDELIEISEAKSKAVYQVKSLEIKISNLETEHSVLKEEKDSVIEENVGLNMLKAELLMKIEKMRIKHENLETEIKKVRNASMKMKQDLDDIQTSHRDVDATLEKTKMENKELESSVKERETKIRELESSSEKSKLNLSELSRKFDNITAEMINLERCINNLKNEKACLIVEKESTSQELSQTSEERNSYKEKLDARRKAYDELNIKYECLQKLSADQETQMESLREELKGKEISLNERRKEIDGLLKELRETKEELETEKQNLTNKCLELKDSNKIFEEAKDDLESLKAKFSLNQSIIRKKEKELNQSQKLIEKLNEDVKKLKDKVKEAHSEAKSKAMALNEAKKEIEEWQENLREKSVQVENKKNRLLEISATLADTQKNNEILNQKLNRLQVQNKKLQLEVAKRIRKKGISTTERSLDSTKTTTSAEHADIVACSQTQGKNLDVNLDASARKAVTRRAGMMGQTTTPTGRRSGRKSSKSKLLKDETDAVEDDARESNSSSPPTRRVTRLALSRSRNSAAKRELGSSNEDLFEKKIKLMDLEGLPHKVRRGLNDIPQGQESPGVITRSTTPLKKKDEDSSRGPLVLLDTNFETKRITSSSKDAKETPLLTSTSVPKNDDDDDDVEKSSDEPTDAEAVPRVRMLPRANLANSRGGALRSRNKLRKPNGSGECRTQ